MASGPETAGALPPGIVKCSSTPWAWAKITATVPQEEWASYKETGYTCVLCTYYKIMLCSGGPERMPKLWGGDLDGHSKTNSHLRCGRNCSTSLQAMEEALEQHCQQGGSTAAASAEAPVARSAAAATAPTHHEGQRRQELEAAVARLQLTCEEMGQRTAAWAGIVQDRHAAMERRVQEQDQALQRLQEAGREQGRYDGGWQCNS